VANVLEQTLNEEKAADKKLTTIAESKVNLKAASVSKHAPTNARAAGAWLHRRLFGTCLLAIWHAGFAPFHNISRHPVKVLPLMAPGEAACHFPRRGRTVGSHGTRRSTDGPGLGVTARHPPQGDAIVCWYRRVCFGLAMPPAREVGAQDFKFAILRRIALHGVDVSATSRSTSTLDDWQHVGGVRDKDSPATGA
jgi:hypothetical protein